MYFTAPDGTVYGYVTPDGRMVLDISSIDPEHPVHEYAHLWDMALAKKNKRLWNRGVELLKGAKYTNENGQVVSLWDTIAGSESYGKRWEGMKGMTPARLESLVASEVHARLVGKEGSRLLENIAKTKGSEGIIGKLKQWLLDAFRELKRAFSYWSDEDIKKLTLDDFVNMTIKDFADGVMDFSKEQDFSRQADESSHDWVESKQPLAETLQQAIDSKGEVRIHYAKANGEVSERFLSEAQWSDSSGHPSDRNMGYINAYDSTRGERRTFRLDRIQHIYNKRTTVPPIAPTEATTGRQSIIDKINEATTGFFEGGGAYIGTYFPSLTKEDISLLEDISFGARQWSEVSDSKHAELARKLGVQAINPQPERSNSGVISITQNASGRLGSLDAADEADFNQAKETLQNPKATQQEIDEATKTLDRIYDKKEKEIQTVFKGVSDFTGAKFSIIRAAGSWEGGGEYSFKVFVEAPTPEAYEKTILSISYMAEAARQDAFIENLGEVDKSTVTHHSLVTREHTPAIHIGFTHSLSEREMALVQAAFNSRSTDALPIDVTITKDEVFMSLPTFVLETEDENGKPKDEDTQYKEYENLTDDWFTAITNIFNQLKEDDRFKGTLRGTLKPVYERIRFHEANKHSEEDQTRSYSNFRDNYLSGERRLGENEGSSRRVGEITEEQGKQIKANAEKLFGLNGKETGPNEVRQGPVPGSLQAHGEQGGGKGGSRPSEKKGLERDTSGGEGPRTDGDPVAQRETSELFKLATEARIAMRDNWLDAAA